jgi:hypothetical protein
MVDRDRVVIVPHDNGSFANLHRPAEEIHMFTISIVTKLNPDRRLEDCERGIAR